MDCISVCLHHDPKALNLSAIETKWGRGKGWWADRHPIGCLQVKQSANAWIIRGLSPVLSNCYLLSFHTGEAEWEGGWDVASHTHWQRGGQFVVCCGGGGTNRGPWAPLKDSVECNWGSLFKTQANNQENRWFMIAVLAFWLWWYLLWTYHLSWMLFIKCKWTLVA